MKKLRYSLAAILFLMLCVGGFISGYKAGFRQGNKKGRAEWDLMPKYLEAYLVADLLESGTTLDDLAGEIKGRVVPVCWDTVGGDCSVQVFAANNSLVVQANEFVHDELANHLEGLRQKLPAPENSASENDLDSQWGSAEKN